MKKPNGHERRGPHAVTIDADHPLIACDVFRSALQHLGVDRPDGSGDIIYLPAHLHLRPHTLRDQLQQCIACRSADRQPAGCLFGQCCPDIDQLLQPRGIDRIACGHCYEILLGRTAYRRLMDRQPGTFFLEKEVILNFDALCRTPLELDDPQIRAWTFEHYRQTVYIRQPRDPDLAARAQWIADFLSLPLLVLDADYGDLIAFLKQHQSG